MKMKIDKHLYERAGKCAEIAGYSSTDEFIIHIIEKELATIEGDGGDDEKIADRLRGLGYIE